MSRLSKEVRHFPLEASLRSVSCNEVLELPDEAARVAMDLAANMAGRKVLVSNLRL